MEAWVPLGYLLSAALFIFGLKKLGHPRTAPRGNQYGALGMLVAVITTVIDMQLADGGLNLPLIAAGLVIGSIIGIVMAVKVEMTGMPELVALFNGFGGAASAWSHFLKLGSTSRIHPWSCRPILGCRSLLLQQACRHS